MKKFTFSLAIAFAVFFSARAQDDQRIFKRFKGDVSMGYAAALSSKTNGGVLFAMEPKFAVMDQLSLGFRIEGALMARFSGSFINGDVDAENARAAGSYIATADYYFSNNYRFRPFIGAGTGVFATLQDDTNFTDETGDVKFGGMIRTGGEVKHFRFGIEFNLIPASSVDIFTYDNNGNSVISKGSFRNSYIGIKAGVCFGGGPR